MSYMSMTRTFVGLLAAISAGTAVIMGIQSVFVALGWGMRWRQRRLEPYVEEIFVGSLILFVVLLVFLIAIRPRNRKPLAASAKQALLPESHGTVWVANRAGIQASNAPRLTYEAFETDQDSALALSKQNAQGCPVDVSKLPKAFHEYIETEDDIPHEGRLGDLLIPGYIIVSKRHADVLGQFDLGQGRIVPLEGIFQPDRKTPHPGKYAILMLGARKEAFVPDQSNQRIIREWADGLGKWHLHVADGRDGDFAVGRSALAGADFWIDPAAPHAYFISDRLMTALREAGLAYLWDAKICLVVDTAEIHSAA